MVVRRGRLLGMESTAGTDALIDSCGASGAALIKVAKPGQDRRVDMPAVGPGTIEGAARSGVSLIAVEAEQVLVFDPSAVRRLCESLGVTLVGLRGNELAARGEVL